MIRYIGRRLLGTIPVLLVVMTLAFVVIRLVPGDPVQYVIGGQPASQQVIENLRQYFGLDQPVIRQYATYMVRAIRGDFGTSFITRQPVTRAFLEQTPDTMKLALGGILIAIVLGGISGVLAGLYPDSWIDSISMFGALIGVSMPSFYIGMLLMLGFAIHLRWVPVVGQGFVGLILPSVTVGIWAAGNLARLIRSALLDVMNQDYIRTARAKGIPEMGVILRHASRNALIPIVTLLGLQLATFFSGAAITEIVFARRGIGRVMIEAVLNQDFPMVQFGILYTVSLYIAINLAVDCLYAVIDPRIRYD